MKILKDLIEQIEEAAEKIERNTKRGSCGKWMYYDPIHTRNVVRSLLFTGGKIYEEIKPGLYNICKDIYQTKYE